MSSTSSPVRVGLIGCGEIAQVVHIPTLNLLSTFFTITYLCDVSPAALKSCQGRALGTPKTTGDPYHADRAILALQNDKFVFLEKPVALNQRDLNRVRDVETASKGQVMVGYMRRYAPAFAQFREEIGDRNDILFARVRDIIGPNIAFVSQSGTFPERFTDFPAEQIEDKEARFKDQIAQALAECGKQPSDQLAKFWSLLSGLGTHDLSAMREALGMPDKVIGVSPTFPFWNVLFQYPGFVVSYESGIDNVPRFDAHIEVYTPKKTIKIEYDTPYVKGLPTKLYITSNKDGVLEQSGVRTTYEDSYTIELLALHETITGGKPVKTTIEDAANDMKLLEMIVRAV
ncbi:unnamed protein product [Penicillium salamii]|nr:unnamed protein product [Penicillium salamii]